MTSKLPFAEIQDAMVDSPILRGMADRIGVHQNAHIQPFRTAAEVVLDQVSAIDLP